MQIQLDEQTKKWIQSKGKPIAIKTLHVNSCCAPPIQEITTYVGKPKDTHNYMEVTIDNMLFFVEKHLSQHGKITLMLSGIGIFKMITAKLCKV